MVYRDGRKVDSDSELEDSEDSGESTTLIPKSLLPDGVKAGDEVRLKVVHSFDGEFEVQYSKSEKKSKDDNVSEEPVSEEMDSANKQLDEMAAAPEA